MPKPKKADEPIAEGADKVEDSGAGSDGGDAVAAPAKRGRKPGVSTKKAPAEPTRDRIPRGAKAAANIKLAEKDEPEVKPKKAAAKSSGAGKGRGRPKKDAAKKEEVREHGLKSKMANSVASCVCLCDLGLGRR